MRIDGLVAKLSNKVAAPVPLHALGIERIEQALHCRIRHQAYPVKSGCWKLIEKRCKCALAVLLRTIIADHDQADPATPEGLGEITAGSHHLEAEKDAKFLRRRGQEVAIGTHDLACRFLWPGERPSVNHANRMRPEKEARDDSKVAAATAQGPEKIRILAAARSHECSVRKDDVGLNQVVNRQPVLTGEISASAAQGEASDAGGRYDPERHRERKRMARMIHISRGAARPCPDGARLRVDPHALHQRKIDHQSIIDASQSRATVAAAAKC